MFCYQCEQTAKGTGCTAFGVCGKDPETAALQDLLSMRSKGIAQYAHRAGNWGRSTARSTSFYSKPSSPTITNVNFDPRRLQEIILKAQAMKERARKLYEDACAGKGKTAGEP